MPVLQTVDLKKYYRQGENVTKALDGVSLEIGAGEFVSVVGTSGSGKSTLLHMMGRLDSPTSGKVIVNGEDISEKSPEQLTVFRRRHIGFVFQNYNLVPVLNVHENIVLPVQLDGKRVDEKLMAEIVEVLGLEDKLENLPENLSGGQQQRVSIARALLTKPEIILADEPTGNADLVRMKSQKENIHAAVFMNHDFLHEGLPEGSLFLRAEGLVCFFPSGGQDGLQVIDIAPGDGGGSSRFLKLRLKRSIFCLIHFFIHQVIHEKVIQLLQLLPDALHFSLWILRGGCRAGNLKFGSISFQRRADVRKKVFFDKVFPEAFATRAAVRLTMLIAAVRDVQLPASISQRLLRRASDKIMIAVRAYKKPGEDVCPVRVALPDITLRKELDAVEPVRGNGGRAEVRDAAIFAFV